jgi:hypothetical protein
VPSRTVATTSGSSGSVMPVPSASYENTSRRAMPASTLRSNAAASAGRSESSSRSATSSIEYATTSSSATTVASATPPSSSESSPMIEPDCCTPRIACLRARACARTVFT